MTKAPRGQLKKAELLVAPVACRVCGLRWRRRRGERGRAHALPRSMCCTSVAFTKLLLQARSLAGFWFSSIYGASRFFFETVFFFCPTTVSGVAISSLRRESFQGFPSFPSQCFFSRCWIGFRRCSSFFLLLFLLILWFFPFVGKGGFSSVV